MHSTAVGCHSMLASLGNNNTGVGFRSLFYAKGNNNIGIGVDAGLSIQDGNNNIIINSSVPEGPAMNGDNNIRIGRVIDNGSIFVPDNSNNCIYIGNVTVQNTEDNVCCIGSIYNQEVFNGSIVYIDANNRLGALPSIRSKKENITKVDIASNRTIVESLIPRRFDFKSGKTEYQQYGLIYDEVIDICPDICINDNEGNPMTINYLALSTMLLTDHQRLMNQADALTLKVNELTEILLSK